MSAKLKSSIAILGIAAFIFSFLLCPHSGHAHLPNSDHSTSDSSKELVKKAGDCHSSETSSHKSKSDSPEKTPEKNGAGDQHPCSFCVGSASCSFPKAQVFSYSFNISEKVIGYNLSFFKAAPYQREQLSSIFRPPISLS